MNRFPDTSDPSGDRLRRLLQESIPRPGRAELERDLWPAMLRRLDRGHSYAFSRLDWALVVLLLLGIILFPQGLPALLYHL